MLEKVTNAVITHYGFSLKDLKSKNKKGKLPEARSVIYYLSQWHYNQEFIAKQFNRDRSSISVAIKKITFQKKHYNNIQNNILKVILIMSTPLEERAEHIENWLRNNPNAEWSLRYDKIKELAAINEQLKELLIDKPITNESTNV